MSLISWLFTPKPSKTGTVTLTFDASQISSAVVANSLKEFSYNPRYSALVMEILRGCTIEHDGATGNREERLARLAKEAKD